MNEYREQRRKLRRRRQALCLAAVALGLLLAVLFIFRGSLLAGARQAGIGTPDGAGRASDGGPVSADAGQAQTGKGLRPPDIPADWEFTIISTGDIMMHSPQTGAGRQADGSYDFAFMFEKVAPILRQADLVIGNLETPLAGAANGGFTGYPMFNAPEALAQDLKDAGFTLVSFANNHSLDRRYQGLSTTLDNLDAAGLLHTGAYRTMEEQGRIVTLDLAGVRIAFLAATYGTNGLTLPGDQSFAVDYINEDKLLADISRARQEGAQYVVVMLHWGVEYQPRPNQDQTGLALSLLRGGADLILGNHPHVLQRGEAIHLAELYAQTEEQAASPGVAGTPPAVYDASGKDQMKFVMYSQGNFVSNQEGMERLVSILLKLTIGVDGATGEPYFKDAAYIPVYTQKRSRQGVSHHIVWPLELARALLETDDPPFGADDRAGIPRAWDHAVGSQPALELLTLRDTPLWPELLPEIVE